MTGAEITGLVASIVSLIIGGFAIWLSVTFYRMSNKSSQELEKASSNINSTVDRLEVLFDKLYSDTFNMMKDTVTDMRNHVWKTSTFKEGTEKTEIEESFDELKKELNEKIESLIASQGSASNRLDGFAKQVESLISETIDKSAKERAEKSWEEKEQLIINAIRKRGPLTEGQLRKITGLPEHDTTSLIFILGREQRLDWDGAPDSFSSGTKFSLGDNA
ncbi:hypothetical protein D4A39_09240 [Alcanivorax profundi]|uniref:Uncharacterized protein n=1 Tax=Alcanivorax profundi TaxID=2338368 RepID=A0A418Y042_9GAMM|nr:hypothetical protein [Alcanivorax profundi]RJG18635.1 hypothetical protein D4A39_09240 [Alcanivorax profundi]